jgi:predicted MFS family arabinose efflux permease
MQQPGPADPAASAVPLTASTEPRPWDSYTGRQRGTYLLILFLVGTSNYVDRNIISVLLEPIKAEFQVSDTMLGLLSGLAFALFYATLGIPVARWADRGDRRLIITLALSVWSLMTVLCGMAQNFWQLALARVGVGAGEAGAIPPSQSLIADYFAPDRRAKALGVFMMSSMAGYVLGLVLGGWAAQTYGWRWAFIIVGAPGLILAIFTRLVLSEPRHLPQFAVKAEHVEPAAAAFRALFRKSSFRNIVYAMILYFVMAYGALVFTVSFMIRVHEVNVAQAGLVFGIVSAIGAVAGNLGGGWLADRLAGRNIAWLGWMPGIALLILMPIYQIAFIADSFTVMVVFLLVGSIMLTGAVPAMFSALHAVCGSKRRATAVAVLFFFANLIGLGLGPVIAGMLSDWLAQSYGPAEGLRYSLIIVMVSFLPSGIFMIRAGSRLKENLEA